MSKRDVQLHFRVTKEEAEQIRLKMDAAGIKSPGAYLRKMALNGYCIRLDLHDVNQLVFLLRNCANNLNQYVKVAHETGSIYEADIRDLQERFDDFWEMAREVMTRLSSI